MTNSWVKIKVGLDKTLQLSNGQFQPELDTLANTFEREGKWNQWLKKDGQAFKKAACEEIKKLIQEWMKIRQKAVL